MSWGRDHPKVTGFIFWAADGSAEIKVERNPGVNYETPRVEDLPEDLQQALKVWLEGIQE